MDAKSVEYVATYIADPASGKIILLERKKSRKGGTKWQAFGGCSTCISMVDQVKNLRLELIEESHGVKTSGPVKETNTEGQCKNAMLSIEDVSKVS